MQVFRGLFCYLH